MSNKKSVPYYSVGGALYQTPELATNSGRQIARGMMGLSVPYEDLPNSPYQWQRRQEGIERQEAERVRLCAIMNKDTDRYRRDCTRPGDPVR